MGIIGSWQDYEHMAYFLILGMAVVLVMAIIIRFIRLGKRAFYIHKKHIRLIVGGIALGSAFAGLCCWISERGVRYIQLNEVCGNNRTIEIVEGCIADYIELYNKSSLRYELDELYLSDDETELKKASLRGYVIEANDFLLIDMNKIDSFSVSKDGETIFLSDEQGNMIDMITVQAMDVDYSYARINEQDEQWGLQSCTPGMSNQEAVKLLEKPILSHESGFYEEAFYLQIDAPENVEIYYTTDGSVPTKEDTRYKEPIYVYDKSQEKTLYRSIKQVNENWKTNDDSEDYVDRAFILRAIAIDEQGNMSQVVNATYFVNKEQYQNRNIISLYVEPDALFGKEGIYVTGNDFEEWYANGKEGNSVKPNFYFRGREWERQAAIEYFSENLSFQQDVGIRIQGNSSRGAALKRFSIYARDEYSGSSVFNVDLFENKQTHSIVLRDSFINVFVNDLVEDRAVGYPESKEITLFLNGEYWYDRYMIEKYSARFFEETFGVDKDNVIVVKDQELDTGYESDMNYFSLLQMYLDTHAFEDENEYLEFCNMVDIDSYIDWYCINVYLCNLDVNENKNAILWRTREAGTGKYNDGKWRWLMYDMDAVAWEQQKEFGVEDAAAIDAFSVQPLYCSAPLNQQPMYKKLRTIPAFCEQFVLTFMDLVNENFTVENVTEKLEAWGENIGWKNSFFAKRTQYAVPYLAREFELQGTLENVFLSASDAEGGYIRLNSIEPDLTKGTWTGMYFTDYPVTVTAVANPGYRFVGWKGTVEATEESMEVYIEEGGLCLDAVFEKVE